MRVLGLRHLQIAVGSAATILLGGGIGYSAGAHHRVVTYALWYGCAAVLAIALLAITILVEQEKPTRRLDHYLRSGQETRERIRRSGALESNAAELAAKAEYVKWFKRIADQLHKCSRIGVQRPCSDPGKHGPLGRPPRSRPSSAAPGAAACPRERARR